LSVHIIGWECVVNAERRGDEVLVLRAWGSVIRRYREWKGLSRRELASRAGLSPVFLGEIERGEKDPSSHTLGLLAGALDAPLAELYLRVAVRLDGGETAPGDEQMAIPFGTRERAADYLSGVPRANDETAFDLYRIARLLPGDQQVSLLLMARSLERASGRKEH
jgi:transcriptional regulator with XRE-family HTH domain